MLHKRGKWWHLHRRVPERFKVVAGKDQVWQSLHTDSHAEAKAKAELVWQNLLDGWSAKLLGHTEDATQRLEAATRLAQARGVRFLKATDVARLPLGEILERVHMVGGTADNPDDLEGEALLGAAPQARIRLSTALELFFELTGDEVLRKSPDQLRRWRVPRMKSVKNFIALLGDKPLDEITRDDLLDVREWLVGQMRAGRFGSNNANKDLMNVRRVFETVNERKRLGLTLDFRRLTIKGGDEETRPPFSTAWIKDKLLAPGALAGLNLEARSILLVMVNTGARPSEIANLLPHHIHLDAPVPHIEIRPEGREVKSKYANRKIPLVGVSLEALRACPQGFARYRDSANVSAAANKYLRENALMETPGHSLYSLRHAFEDRMIAAGIDDRVRRDLFGHRLSREKYGTGATLEHMQELLQAIAL